MTYPFRNFNGATENILLFTFSNLPCVLILLFQIIFLYRVCQSRMRDVL